MAQPDRTMRAIIFADITLREQRYVINVPLPHCPRCEVPGVVDKMVCDQR